MARSPGPPESRDHREAETRETEGTTPGRAAGRLVAISLGYGTVAGLVAAVTLWLMTSVTHLVWGVSDARWYIVLAVLVGGALIAVMRRASGDLDIPEQLSESHDPIAIKKKATLFLALSAIVAVGFGGAVGPEAGLLAVTAECSAIVAMLIARTRAEQRVVGEAGAAGALAALFGSPPGAAAYEDDELGTPKALAFLAASGGLVGFVVGVRWLLPGGGFIIHLPDRVATMDGSDLLYAVVPGIAGALAGLGFLLVLPRLSELVHRVPGLVAQTMVGTAAFAVLAAVIPEVRFSGHHELEVVGRLGEDGSWWTLVALGIAKVLALSICLSSGWKGGIYFPLAFVGAAVGVATLALVPGAPGTVALVAGMAAAATVGMRKPVAVLLITVLLLQPPNVGSVTVGVAVGFLLLKALGDRLPEPTGH